MDEIMMLHMISSMMCCYYPYTQMFPENIFRPWGKMGDFSIHASRQIPLSGWDLSPHYGGFRKLLRHVFSPKRVFCTARELIDFVLSVNIPDYSIEFLQDGEWHIIESWGGRYALDGHVEKSYSGFEKLYRKTVVSDLEIIRFNVPVRKYLEIYLGKWKRYVREFVFVE